MQDPFEYDVSYHEYLKHLKKCRESASHGSTLIWYEFYVEDRITELFTLAALKPNEMHMFTVALYHGQSFANVTLELNGADSCDASAFADNKCCAFEKQRHRAAQKTLVEFFHNHSRRLRGSNPITKQGVI